MDEDTNAVAVRESEISRVIKSLDVVVEMSAKQFDDLSSRLSSVLRVMPPKNDTEKAATPEYSTSLAQNINNSVLKLRALVDWVGEVKSRIEL